MAWLFKLTFIVEIVVWFTGVWVIITQIVWPAITGTKFFPWFRTSNRAADTALIEATNAAQVDAVLKEAQSKYPTGEETKPVKRKGRVKNV